MMAELDDAITSSSAAASTATAADDDFDSIFGGGDSPGGGEGTDGDSSASSSSSSSKSGGFRSSYEKDDFNNWLTEGLDESTHKRRTNSVVSDGGFDDIFGDGRLSVSADDL